MVGMGFIRVKWPKSWLPLSKNMVGFITEEDLEKYEAKWRQPIIFDYKDLKIISMSPPSSGGVTMNQILKMMETL